MAKPPLEGVALAPNAVILEWVCPLPRGLPGALLPAFLLATDDGPS
jgi:hypothetical protein